jgi:hypothetical protein
VLLDVENTLKPVASASPSLKGGANARCKGRREKHPWKPRAEVELREGVREK